MTTTATGPIRVITDREIGAAELQMAINARHGTATLSGSANWPT